MPMLRKRRRNPNSHVPMPQPWYGSDAQTCSDKSPPTPTRKAHPTWHIRMPHWTLLISLWTTRTKPWHLYSSHANSHTTPTIHRIRITDTRFPQHSLDHSTTTLHKRQSRTKSKDHHSRSMASTHGTSMGKQKQYPPQDWQHSYQDCSQTTWYGIKRFENSVKWTSPSHTTTPHQLSDIRFREMEYPAQKE